MLTTEQTKWTLEDKTIGWWRLEEALLFCSVALRLKKLWGIMKKSRSLIQNLFASQWVIFNF